ncbi:hypothetical protein WJX79_005726 [Trebouxia sp. C0005]|nr:MAG: glutathione S-transferase [Trebouxia sp. A1-2]
MVSLTKFPSNAIQFYDSGTCPFAQRAWITLIEKKLNFEQKIVDLQNKPKHFKELYASIHPDPTAPAKVPIIIDGDNQLIESNVVSEYLDVQYRSSGVKLFPEDPLQLAKVRWFVDLFSETFMPSLFGLLRADSEESLQAAKTKMDTALKNLDKFVEQHGSSKGGDYFLGGGYSFAEVAATPFLHRASAALPALRGYSIDKAIQQQKLTRLDAWIKAALARPSYNKTAPADDTVAKSWQKFSGGYNGHVKQ